MATGSLIPARSNGSARTIVRLNQTNSGGCWTERNVLRTWQNCHFAPIFIRRKAEEQEKSYYFVGSAVALDDVHASVNPGEDGSESKVVISTLKLDKPVDPELYRHLTGKSAL